MNNVTAAAKFKADMKLCCDMSDRKMGVERLAKEVGADAAEEIARSCGLHNGYYFSGLDKVESNK